MEGAVLTFPLEQDITANRSVASPQPVFASGNSADDPAPSILMYGYGVLIQGPIQEPYWMIGQGNYNPRITSVFFK